MKFPLNGKKIDVSLTVGTVWDIEDFKSSEDVSELSKKDIVETILSIVGVIEKGDLDKLPFECTSELADILDHINSKLAE